MNAISFKTTRSFYDVVIEETGEKFQLREMTAAARDKYAQQMGDRMRVSAEGVMSGIKNYDGLQAALLTACLWEVETDKLVSKEKIQAWPASQVAMLFEAANELNGFNKKKADETPEKNG